MMRTMSADPFAFQRRAVRPVDCIKQGFASIKDDYWLFLGLSLVAILVGSVAPFGILLGPMMCGLHMCLLRRQRGEPAGFDVLFKGFDYFGPSLVTTLIQMVPMIILIVPIYILMILMFIGVGTFLGAVTGEAPPIAGLFLPVVMVAVFVVFLAGLLFAMIFAFSYQLIVDRGASGTQAVAVSAKAVFGNFGGVFMLTLLTAMMGIGGVMLCYVGAFLVMPISFAAVDQAYRQVFPLAPPLQVQAPPQYAPDQHPWMG